MNPDVFGNDPTNTGFGGDASTSGTAAKQSGLAGLLETASGS